jgi:hypothetical protein
MSIRASALAVVVAFSPLLPSAGAPPASASFPVSAPITVTYPGTPIWVPPAVARAHHINLKASTPAAGFPTPGNFPWSGYIVRSVPGKMIVHSTTTFQIPAVNCRTTKMGNTGLAFTDAWSGLGGTGAGLEQAGIQMWCSGPAIGFGTAGPFFLPWYFICCKSPNIPLGIFPRAPALHTGDLLTFVTNWAANVHEYQFIVYWGDGSHETAYLRCPSGIVGGCSNTGAEVIVEDPGTGPPADPMVQWPQISCAGLPGTECFAGIPMEDNFFTSADGAQGTLAAKAGEWGAPQRFSINAVPLPQVMPGDKNNGVGIGAPDPLFNDGAGSMDFVSYCELEQSTGAILYCPSSQYR